jgi:transposase
MSQSRRFTKEFEAEAVQLVQASGRTQREVAADLGIGLSTLVRWIGRNRDRQIDHPPPGRQEDMATELKRLRRENEILRQERDILKRATAFFAREGSR